MNANAGELSVKDASRHEQKIKMNIESVGSPSIFDTGRFPDVLNKITGGADLEEAEAYAVMSWVLSGSASPSQIAALLIALKSKGETVEEMSGFVLAMLDVAERVNPGYTVLDTCGTGGDGLGTINISTIVAFIAAGAGAKVCKHGGRSASSLTGSADLLEELGVTIDLGAEGVSKCIDEVGMGFLFCSCIPSCNAICSTRAERAWYSYRVQSLGTAGQSCSPCTPAGRCTLPRCAPEGGSGAFQKRMRAGYGSPR